MEEFLGSTWSMQDVSRALHESGFVWKCVENKAAELDPFKMQLYREMWDRRGYTVNQPVFVDEVGTVRLKRMSHAFPSYLPASSREADMLASKVHGRSLRPFPFGPSTFDLQNSLVVNKRRGWVQVGERSTSRTICG